MNKPSKFCCDDKYLSLPWGREVSWVDHKMSVQQTHRETVNSAETAWLSLLDFNQFFSSQKLPFFGYLPPTNATLSDLHCPSTYPFPEITTLKHQNHLLLQKIYHTETIDLKITSQNLFYWLALKTIRCLAVWVPVRLLLATSEILACFMEEHI